MKKVVNGPRKAKGPTLEVRKLMKKLGIKSNIDISRRKTWFSDAMDNLDKKEQ